MSRSRRTRLTGTVVELDEQFFAIAWRYPGGYVVEYYRRLPATSEAAPGRELQAVKPYNPDQIGTGIKSTVLEELRARRSENAHDG